MAGITFASKLRRDRSFTIPKAAVDTLGLHPGDDIQVHIETSSLTSGDQAYYEQKLNELIAEADRIKLTSTIQPIEPHTPSFGEILKEKYRKQGFDL